jgi:hypothetical protein
MLAAARSTVKPSKPAKTIKSAKAGVWSPKTPLLFDDCPDPYASRSSCQFVECGIEQVEQVFPKIHDHRQ